MGETSLIVLSNYQRLILWLNGWVIVGKAKREGWIKETNLYAFMCPNHGLTSSVVHGYREKLECSHCLAELREEQEI